MEGKEDIQRSRGAAKDAAKGVVFQFSEQTRASSHENLLEAHTILLSPVWVLRDALAGTPCKEETSRAAHQSEANHLHRQRSAPTL